MIRALQVARYVWKIYAVDDDGKVDIWNYRGQVQAVSDCFYPLRVRYPNAAEMEGLLEPLDAQFVFRTLAEAAEAIA